MRSVLLRLEGPLQSWGTQGRFGIRDTDTEPSKSGVLGVVGAALGMPRDDEATLADLAALVMAVRVDREGRPLRDFHTVGAGRFRGDADYAVHGAGGKTVVTDRHYLADASFLVALGGENNVLIDRIAQCLEQPVWPLYLGRRSCPPAVPVFAGRFDGTPEAAVRAAVWDGRGQRSGRLRLVLEAADGRPRNDVPLSFVSSARRHRHRYVRIEWMDAPAAPAQEEVTP